MQIFSCNLLVPDTCIGGAILKVQGGVSGQSTDWVELKNQTNELVGRVMVSISRETLEIEGEYTHLVQNTEECMMVGGDQDDPQIDEFSDIDCQVQLPQQIFDDEVEDNISDQSSIGAGGQLDEHLQEVRTR